METFSAFWAFCAGNSPVTSEFPTQRPVTRSLGVFFDLPLNKRLSKQSWGWWFETPSRPLWHDNNVANKIRLLYHVIQNANGIVSGTVNENWSNSPFLSGFQWGNGMNIFYIPEYQGKDIR